MKEIIIHHLQIMFTTWILTILIILCMHLAGFDFNKDAKVDCTEIVK
jgi:hypothetical protein